MVGRGWKITFSDVLLLLLTFFVFLISVSVFKTKDYKKFWEKYDQDKKMLGFNKKGSYKFKLIEGLNLPKLSPVAEKMLLKLEDQFQESNFAGLSVIYNENTIKLVINQEDNMFKSGEFKVSNESTKKILLEMIPHINESDFLINIQGHTDSSTAKGINNMDLSLQRALNIADFFASNGLSKDKISVSGYGPYRPITTNNTSEGKALNRRVEVNIIINYSKFK